MENNTICSTCSLVSNRVQVYETQCGAVFENLPRPDRLLLREVFPRRFVHSDVVNEASNKRVEMISFATPLGQGKPKVA